MRDRAHQPGPCRAAQAAACFDGPGEGALAGHVTGGQHARLAKIVLDLGGHMVAVIPSPDYRQAKVEPDHAETFDRLTAAADEVLVLAHDTASRHAYEDANRTLLKRADRLIAVWDGQPPTGRGGGTADTVLEAREAGLPVDAVWPTGAARQN